MIELIDGLPEPVVGLRARGRVGEDDYVRVAGPAIHAMAEAHRRIRVLYVLGEDFDGFSIGAMWEDAKLGVGRLTSWERIAVVTDADWMHHALRAMGWMMPGDVRAFGAGEEDAARTWVAEGLAPS